MATSYVKYRTPREALGKWSALDRECSTDNSWDLFYNDEQKEYWYRKADELLKFMKKGGYM